MKKGYKIQPGDIILFRVIPSSSWVSKLIGWAQKLIGKQPPCHKEYCHVALVDFDTHYMLEAKWPKIKSTLINFRKLELSYGIEVYRVHNINEEQFEKAIDWAHEHIGEWYDLLLLLTGIFDSKHTEICSTFVAKAFNSAGLEVPCSLQGHKLITPNMFALDTKLERVA